MLRIAIIEDQQNEASKLENYISRYIERNEKYRNNINIELFNSAVDFLKNSNISYDITFFDIEMPGLNGMEAATKLREFDKQTIIIFVTNLTQYAIKGYQVNALDYIIKPITYNDIIIPLERALLLASNNEGQQLTVRNVDGLSRIDSRSIAYIEVLDHKLTFHTDQGLISGSGSLTKVEETLANHPFLRCNNCYLVNPKYIKTVVKNFVIMMDGSELKISNPRKKAFMLELTEWLGKGNVV